MTRSTVLATVVIDPPTTLVVGAVTALISSKLIARGGLPEVWRAGLVSALGVGLLVHLGRRTLAWGVALSCVATLGLLGSMTAAQYVKIGTTAEWNQGAARALAEDPAMVTAMNVVTAVLVVGAATAVTLQVRRTLQASRPS